LIYLKNRKQVKQEERKAQQVIANSRTETKDAAPAAVYKAERMLLNLMFFSKTALRTATEEITPEELTDPKNRALFSAILRFKEENNDSSAPLFLSALPEELKMTATDILYKEYMGDAVAAAKDNIDKIKKHNLNILINQLATQGKIDEINRLIRMENERRNNID